MRTAFFRKLLDLAAQDERINLVVGDLGFGLVEPFAEKFPRQFLNAGVAEQNMTGVSAGMALSGKVVFTYSIANFPILRCFEQIRNDVCYHRANVKIVAVGGGLCYGALGMTHHATEDIAVMRALPEMTVVAPGDPLEAEWATAAVAERSGPAYLRLGRAGEPIVHQEQPDFQLGRAVLVRQGYDWTLISTGGMLQTAVKVAGRLADENVEVRVLSMHTLKPIDRNAVLEAAEQTRGIVTLEEHSVIGGLGSAVAEVLAEADGVPVKFKRIGLPSAFCSDVGTQDYLRQIHGLSEKGIVESLRPMLKATLG
jgi:transketolase